MLTIEAKIYFKKQEEGGLHKNGVSGMQPSFSVTDDLIMCKVIGKGNVTDFMLGKEYEVSIELPYGEMFEAEIQKGYQFHLNIGGKEFANGVVL
ncbi:hypothetical protein RND59_00790 [Vibrio ruber]|uniref:hypothetical protein n=1 Tax=Vibrio ruber TaxID=184755 RepID=UPI00289337B5|nr:hypothetical protein [Vibrio ruber]WNJ95693.1 hypothetical protein RND59_00790 [Vibrio ruber]